MQPGPPAHEPSVQVRIATAHDAAAMAELIGHLVTSPSMRNRGVGRALVDVVQSWALERGAEKLVVTTALHRVEAPRFYERLGFEQTGRRFVKRLKEL
jgi:GNAT superfamily N-acetyltransferase